MGVVLSSTASLSPFSLTTGIIGLVSFAFTVSTFLKIVWTNLETVGEAPHEVHTYLTNLRQELVEERNSLRTMRRLQRDLRKRNAQRKRPRSVRSIAGGTTSGGSGGGGGGGGNNSGVDVGSECVDEVSLKTMTDSIKRLIRRFAELERPFLETGEHGITEQLHAQQQNRHRHRRQGSSVSPYYSHEAYGGTGSYPEKADGHGARGSSRERRGRRAGGGGPRESEEDDEEIFWAQRIKYAKYSLIKRLRWLWAKPEAEQLFAVLTRVQVRRVAQQMGGLARLSHEYGQYTLDMEDAVRRIEDRLNRFVSVRRLDH